MITLAVFGAAVAVADIAPPPGYVERCTVARVQKENPGQTCVSCDAWHGGREDCEQHEAQGYVKQCKTRGASTWDEVLCKAGTPAAEPAPDPTPGEPTEAEPAEPAQEEPNPAEAGLEAEPQSAGCTTVPGLPGGWFLALTVLIGRRSRARGRRPGTGATPPR